MLRQKFLQLLDFFKGRFPGATDLAFVEVFPVYRRGLGYRLGLVGWVVEEDFGYIGLIRFGLFGNEKFPIALFMYLCVYLCLYVSILFMCVCLCVCILTVAKQ